MKFLIDQDVYAATGHFISQLGHDVVRAAQIGLSQAADEELLKIAQEQGRILVTRDRDFSSLVFLKSAGPVCSISAYYPQHRMQFTLNSNMSSRPIPRSNSSEPLL